ncbi:MAG: hypothetical protein MK538_03495 [Planctomycetes bacterium]|nr:hypothetical protein [Planctomycetota bacterium]
MGIRFFARRLWAFASVSLIVCSIGCHTAHSEEPATGGEAFRLSDEHIAAVNKRRRIVVNHPADGLLEGIRRKVSIENLLEYELGFTQEKGNQIDAQWWCLDRLFPLKSRPMHLRERKLTSFVEWDPAYDTIYRWAEEGFHILREYLSATKARGLECFYSYRISDAYCDTEFGEDFAAAHPEWTVEDEWAYKKWNFAIPEVRARKLAIMKELAEDFDFDGLEIDFARGPNNLPKGRLWPYRDGLTKFLRDLRAKTLEVESSRRRPFLIAARVPDTVVGCHFDGLDVETWIRENLVDILVLGVRSYDLEIERFRYLIGTKPIKVYATLDDHHCTDGYSWPPIEVMRGVVANWYQQGMDTLQTFNWGTASPEVAAKTGMHVRQAYRDDSDRIAVYQQAYRELGSPETLRFKDKTFVVQRRGGGGSGGSEVHDWHTPRASYQNTNMLAPLPALLDNTGKADTLVRLRVGDDVAADAAKIQSLTLQILLSDPTTAQFPEDRTIERAPINPFWTIPQLHTSPPVKGIEKQLEVRLNGVLLDQGIIQDGWVVYRPNVKLFAVGENLVGVLVKGRDLAGAAMSLEKVEARVDYLP